MGYIFKSKEEAWEIIRGPQGKELRKEAHAFFKKEFPQGHRTSIKDIVEVCTNEDFRRNFEKEFLKSLKSFHPRAFLLLALYGQDYTPRYWSKPPSNFKDIVHGGCFINAYREMRCFNAGNQANHERAVFVEGLAYGAFCSPMLHAWNALDLEGKKAFDVTLCDASHWIRYFGIPFTDEEHQEACSIAYQGETLRISLLHKKHFEKVEYFLHQILKRREEARLQEKLWGA